VGHHEYWTERAKLGEALRNLRWERRAIQDIFRHTKDPTLLVLGLTWVRAIVARDVVLCRQIKELDLRYQQKAG
jgi:hypothetical protein